MCNTCDLALNLSAPETFWQLFMEKEFMRALVLSEQANCSEFISTQMSADKTSDRRLTFVEENAVQYTAGYMYHIRKLERIKTQNSIECMRALREMAGKPSTCDTASHSQSK